MPLKICVDLPYPTLVGIEKDVKSAAVIAPAYASMHGELNAALQYLYHYFSFKEYSDVETGEIIIGIALCELHHLKILGELLSLLGVDPIFAKAPPLGYNFYSAENVCYSKTPMKMLVDDVSSELYSIKQYEKMASLLTNEKIRAVIKRIIIDEEFHVKVLKERLSALGGDSVKNF